MSNELKTALEAHRKKMTNDIGEYLYAPKGAKYIGKHNIMGKMRYWYYRKRGWLWGKNYYVKGSDKCL